MWKRKKGEGEGSRDELHSIPQPKNGGAPNPQNDLHLHSPPPSIHPFPRSTHQHKLLNSAHIGRGVDEGDGAVPVDTAGGGGVEDGILGGAYRTHHLGGGEGGGAVSPSESTPALTKHTPTPQHTTGGGGKGGSIAIRVRHQSVSG